LSIRYRLWPRPAVVSDAPGLHVENQKQESVVVNSRAKGAAGERELSKVLGELLGVPMRRGQQFSGLAGNADVVGIEGLHVECKRVQSLNVSKAIQQSIRDSKPGSVPVVAHRKNGEQWLLTCCLDDLVDLSRLIVDTVDGRIKSDGLVVVADSAKE
jgi:Holliday junction resolvase